MGIDDAKDRGRKLFTFRLRCPFKDISSAEAAVRYPDRYQDLIATFDKQATADLVIPESLLGESWDFDFIDGEIVTSDPVLP